MQIILVNIQYRVYTLVIPIGKGRSQMIMCYGKTVESIEVVTNKWGQSRCLVQYGKTGKVHDVSPEAISWVSSDWFDKD